MMAEKNNKLRKVNFLDKIFLRGKIKRNYGANKSKLESNLIWASGRDGSTNCGSSRKGSKNPDLIDVDRTMWIRSEADMLSCCTG